MGKVRLFFKFLFYVVGIGSIYGGIKQWDVLQAMRSPASDYHQVEGQIVELKSYWEAEEAAIKYYHVEYEFEGTAGRRRSDQLAPFCRDCTLDQLIDVTGKSPNELVAGTSIRVFVSKRQTEHSYLGLATQTQIWRQWWSVLFRLIVIPMIAFFASRMDWTKSNESSADKF